MQTEQPGLRCAWGAVSRSAARSGLQPPVPDLTARIADDSRFFSSGPLGVRAASSAGRGCPSRASSHRLNSRNTRHASPSGLGRNPILLAIRRWPTRSRSLATGAIWGRFASSFATAQPHHQLGHDHCDHCGLLTRIPSRAGVAAHHCVPATFLAISAPLSAGRSDNRARRRPGQNSLARRAHQTGV
jgi:hypothetical protein